MLPRLAPTNGNTIDSRPLQPENAEEPMLVTLSGTVICIIPLHPENAELPIVFTPSIMVMFVIDRYADEKIDEILLVHTHCGIVTLVSPLQP